MSDLISRQDAIKALGDAHFQNYGYAIMVVMDLPSAEPERKWIPVTEALPKNSEHDWVLGQIRETDSGYLWIPKVVEYRESSDDWFAEKRQVLMICHGSLKRHGIKGSL